MTTPALISHAASGKLRLALASDADGAEVAVPVVSLEPATLVERERGKKLADRPILLHGPCPGCASQYPFRKAKTLKAGSPHSSNSVPTSGP